MSLNDIKCMTQKPPLPRYGLLLLHATQEVIEATSTANMPPAARYGL